MTVIAITNPSFEDGNTGWTLESGLSIGAGSGYDAFDGTWSLRADTGWAGSKIAEQDTFTDVGVGKKITASIMVQQGASSSGNAGASLLIYWYDVNKVKIGEKEGNVVNSGSGGAWYQSTVTDTSPEGTRYVKLAVKFFRNSQNLPVWADLVKWDLEGSIVVNLTSPLNGSAYSVGDVVELKVEITGSTPPVKEVEYFYGSTSIGVATAAPYNLNTVSIPAGTWSITAVAKGTDDSTWTSALASTITVSAVPPVTREYKASNTYTNLVMKNFSGLTANMPSTALVTGIEVLIDYDMKILVRSKDLGNDDPATSIPEVAFDATNDGVFELSMLQGDEQSYTAIGAPITGAVPIARNAFAVTETALTDGKKWTVFDNETTFHTTIGSATTLFGGTPIAANDFSDRALGLRFYPNLSAKPSYADSGDACFRMLLDKVRLRVYFDAGSVEYYFASPDKTHVVKAKLVSAEVLDGNFETADASGVLQLAADLEVVDGSGVEIGCDYTIHAAYPVTDANQIGVVVCQDGNGMVYNGLPTQQQVKDNRSRYVMISANFYGDKNLNSIYGANGLSRGFAFNKNFFYKIYTQPDEDKDRPRHVAEYHQHLALGFDDGRVDISVAGKPYNFSGLLGASSWATGDSVTGLLKLSGTILGVYGTKSITGISGTTVDNFATQTISPNIGATEYTVCDMGFPVHANAYGVYTLSQVQQYGDYMGTPMSADISPWLRPRLIRKVTSDKEVVVAWPVRSKNQYRLAFSDGYVVSMTLNGQAVPTFSFQKYFTGTEPVEDLYTQRSIVPAAVSSELDESGEERIHIAPYIDMPTPAAVCMELTASQIGGSGSSCCIHGAFVNAPGEFSIYDGFEIDWYDDGNFVPYDVLSAGNWQIQDGFDSFYGPATGKGVLRQTTEAGEFLSCLLWEVPAGV